jgi:hypothetical protein
VNVTLLLLLYQQRPYVHVVPEPPERIFAMITTVRARFRPGKRPLGRIGAGG